LISSLAADCSSDAVAMELTCMDDSSTRATMRSRAWPERSARFVASSILPTAFSTLWMVVAAPLWMPWMLSATSLVAVMVFSASLRTSSATTANPRPASPARAASMAAFRASRLV